MAARHKTQATVRSCGILERDPDRIAWREKNDQ
jgi:hypothetical protein